MALPDETALRLLAKRKIEAGALPERHQRVSLPAKAPACFARYASGLLVRTTTNSNTPTATAKPLDSTFAAKTSGDRRWPHGATQTVSSASGRVYSRRSPNPLRAGSDLEYRDRYELVPRTSFPRTASASRVPSLSAAGAAWGP